MEAHGAEHQRALAEGTVLGLPERREVGEIGPWCLAALPCSRTDGLGQGPAARRLEPQKRATDTRGAVACAFGSADTLYGSDKRLRMRWRRVRRNEGLTSMEGGFAARDATMADGAGER